MRHSVSMIQGQVNIGSDNFLVPSEINEEHYICNLIHIYYTSDNIYYIQYRNICIYFASKRW